VVSSETVADSVRVHYPQAADKLRVLRFRTALQDAWFRPDPAAVARQYDLPERFFIVCNQFWQHKNHAAVFAALMALRTQGVCPTIVCTGPLADYRRPDHADRIRRTLDDFHIADQVRLLALIPREDQIQLMRRSLAVIQPSRFEGWSSVVEDARSLGKVIALSDIPVHREQNPLQAFFFAPDDSEALAGALREWWLSLTPGPQAGHEEEGRRQNRLECANYAEKFLEIALGSAACNRVGTRSAATIP
jgi:glycosyltransferase involved in cell wall biosynthesis